MAIERPKQPQAEHMHHFSSPIINNIEEIKEQWWVRDTSVALYPSMIHLLMHYLVMMAAGWPTMCHVQTHTCRWDGYWLCVTWISASRVLSGFWQLKSDFLPKRDIDDESGQENCKDDKSKSSIYLFPGSHHFVLYPDHLEELPAHTLKMMEFISLPNAFHIVCDYPWHTGAEWHGKYRHYYHSYLILENVVLKQGFKFYYGNSLIIALEGSLRHGRSLK